MADLKKLSKDLSKGFKDIKKSAGKASGTLKKSADKAGDSLKKGADKASDSLKILEVNKQIKGFEEKIEAKKVALGNKALALAAAGKLNVPDLKPIVAEVDTLKAKIADKKKLIQNIKKY